MSIDNPREQMAQDQIDVYDTYLNQAIEEFNLCHRNYLFAIKAAEVNLPAKAVSGKPMIHRSRMLCNSVAEYWLQRKQLLRMKPSDVIRFEQEVEKDLGILPETKK